MKNEYQTRNGEKVTVYTKQGIHPLFPWVGEIKYKDRSELHRWSEAGIHPSNNKSLNLIEPYCCPHCGQSLVSKT